jgi:dihydrofolate synthase / folylpolyglutamate synthase
MSSLEEWLVEHYGREAYKPGLERIQRVLGELIPRLNKKSITIIAGTNGKGETTHRLRHYFSHSRYCAWTSPHILYLSERFSSEQGDIPQSELTQLILRTHHKVQELKGELTYYEFLFFVFCTWALEREAEYLFLEVGLGGRLDAVNVLDAQLVLLTSISRDHQEFLGPRYDMILGEKLGVLRPGAQLMSFLDLQYLRDRAGAIAQERGASWMDLSEVSELSGYAFSQRNQLLAYGGFCHLTNRPFHPQECVYSPVPLLHRGEVLKERNEWHFYGAHNVDGMRKLIQFLQSGTYTLGNSCRAQLFDYVVVSFSRRDERDVVSMLAILKWAKVGRVIVTSFFHPKAYPPASLEELARQQGLDFVASVDTVVDRWSNQKILVAGSYYFLGSLKSQIRTS